MILPDGKFDADALTAWRDQDPVVQEYHRFFRPIGLAWRARTSSPRVAWPGAPSAAGIREGPLGQDLRRVPLAHPAGNHG